MSSTFWSNTIWYILLGITTIIELIFIFVKARNRKQVLAIYISLAGLVFAFEITILGGHHAYQYFPKVIPQSAFDDGIIGNYFSQFSVSASALLIAIYELNYFWYFTFAGMYGLVEKLFLKLGIYEHYWYRTWMTLAGLPLLFWVGKKFYESTLERIRRSLLYIYIFLGLITLQIHTMWIFRVLGIFSFGPSLNVPPESARSDILISVAYMLLAFNVMIAIYFSKIMPFWKILAIIFFYIAQYIAFKLHLMYFKEGWFFIFTTISIFSLYFYIFILYKLYRQIE